LKVVVMNWSIVLPVIAALVGFALGIRVEESNLKSRERALAKGRRKRNR
jgi:hypothetical protein